MNRSKRLLLLAQEPPKVAGTVKPGARQAGAYFFFLNKSNCSSRRSSASCSRIYRRTASGSCPTVVTKYPRAQKCSPIKFCRRPPYVRAM